MTISTERLREMLLAPPPSRPSEGRGVMKDDLFTGGAAVISSCGKYRYRLDRSIADAGPVYAFFGINPSTADASLDDATVRKWRGFVTRWGGSRFIVGNVFAYRSTDVRALSAAADPIGRLNNDYLKQIIAEADILIPCWGDQKKVAPQLRMHFRWMRQVLTSSGKPVKSFGLSGGGFPKHPLMLGYDTQLVTLEPPHDQ